MLNPDGVIVGNYRCSLAGRDLNRHYKTILKESFPCIWHTRNMIKRLLEEREVLLYCDFHGHSRKNNIFLYGCNSNDRKYWLHERVFPFMLSKNVPDKFSFHSCNFKVQKCKEGTGRVVMWRMGILNSYTMESTFGGSTLGNKRDTHFTTEDLKSLGYHVCDTLLDFCDPDRTKYFSEAFMIKDNKKGPACTLSGNVPFSFPQFMQCLVELKELLQQEIYKKFNELGQDMDLERRWNDISLSDIESSTSGSDSSLSDGLPVHLLNIAHELNHKKKMYKKKKKKPLQTRKQRNEQYQKNNMLRELKSTEDALVRKLCCLLSCLKRPGFASTLQKQPTFLKNSENASSSTVKNERPRMSEAFQKPPAAMAQTLSSWRQWRRELSVLLAQSATPATLSPAPCVSCWPNRGRSGVMSQLNGRDKDISLDPSKATSLILTKNKERKQHLLQEVCREKSQDLHALQREAQTPAKSQMQIRSQTGPGTRFLATKRGHTTMAGYPSLHIYTYP
ncbi:hypothetical protein QTO34_003538 [Cnephaeus nilssonii]|uniref:Peptidase M14 domain-containing protein n=1 Tax=Cnephaeus nilssonii TaxID=3371016 RepID=A0AA40LLE7_CNENI|nr:hypothetical protein QTO34_003538 [Eptesicus nilssonii]